MNEEGSTTLVVADVYRLSRVGKKFNEDIKTAQPKHKLHLIDRAYADEMNTNWATTGIKCIIDEEASMERENKILASAAKRKERDEARDTAANAVASMALGINKADPTKDNTPETNEELEAARAEYFDLTGEEAHHRKGLKGINEMIKEYKNNN